MGLAPGTYLRHDRQYYRRYGCFPDQRADFAAFALSRRGCLDIDGRDRAGALTIALEEVLGEAAGAFTASSSGLTVTGTKIRFAMSGNSSGAGQAVELDSCFVWIGGAWALKTQGLLSYTMTAGNTTTDHTDDAYVVNRSGNGLDRDGRAYSVSTSTPLRYALDCPWVTEGKEPDHAQWARAACPRPRRRRL